jgi:hypothetical protein
MRPSALDRPILITGTPRSGKTVLRELIRKTADEFLVAVEPSPTWNVGRRARDHDRRTAEEATPAVRRRIRRECESALARSGRLRYADELAYHALRIPFVHAVLPEAKIVHVIRNPEQTIGEINFWWSHDKANTISIRVKVHQVRLLALPRLALRYAKNVVSRSLRGRPAAWGPMPPGLAEYAASHGPAEIAGYQWARLVEYATEDLARLPQDRVLELRYERLVEQPEREAARLAEFCEVRDPARLVAEACRTIDPHHPPYAALEPTGEEWDAIWKEIGPVANHLGYLRDPLHAPRTVFPARMR